ncbi:hypothetical protein O1R50_25840 [Glycomyces luteolus]|uniref:Uncharacterized protein n=1 Tax=Glycomyces luteolus TaxID=2670330 RepID=A0A9X3PFF1_9ACTN|nr:hypothetical protein [Glycomyces luteolus]MDA1363061.1 hypothetical protein [Glycomyces luteolus]
MRSPDADSYLDGPLGWTHQSMQRLLREVHLADENEPVTKKQRAGRHRAVEFQHNAVTAMRSAGRRSMTGAVALDVHFTCGERNPPSIHHLAKHLLDVLGPAINPEDLGRQSVVYRDDRQVKLLHVTLDQAWNPNPDAAPKPAGTRVIARPIRDVAEDLRVADEIQSRLDRWPQEDDTGPFHIPAEDFDDDPVPWSPQDGRLPEETESLAQLARFDRHWRLMRAQEAHLAATDAYLLSYLCACPNDIAGTRQFPAGGLESHAQHAASLSEMYRPLLLTLPFGLPLPGFALASGEWKRYGQQARTALASFLDRWPLFRPLLIPVTVTLLVTPSIRGMDLDNIALTLLPIIHDVLRPHIDPFTVHQLGLTPPSTGTEHEEHMQALRRLRSLNEYSVTAYQVIELKRTSRTPPEGTITLLLGDGIRRQSAWETASDYLRHNLPALLESE